MGTGGWVGWTKKYGQKWRIMKVFSFFETNVHIIGFIFCHHVMLGVGVKVDKGDTRRSVVGLFSCCQGGKAWMTYFGFETILSQSGKRLPGFFFQGNHVRGGKVLGHTVFHCV